MMLGYLFVSLISLKISVLTNYNIRTVSSKNELTGFDTAQRGLEIKSLICTENVM